eukprot:10605088-Alexandrium_andersonii.AAC.1
MSMLLGCSEGPFRSRSWPRSPLAIVGCESLPWARNPSGCGGGGLPPHGAPLVSTGGRRSFLPDMR